MKIKPEKIKDAILSALKNTQNPDEKNKEISLKEEEFLPELYKKYEEKNVDFYFEELFEQGYVNRWPNKGSSNVYAIKNKGKIKLEGGGFIADKKLTPKEKKMLILGALLGIVSTVLAGMLAGMLVQV